MSFPPARPITAGLLLLCVARFAWCLQGADATSSSTLYVLSSPQTLSSPDIVPYSELLFIDLTRRTVRRTIRIGSSADAQLSPDGRRIYVTSSYVSGLDSPDREYFIETYDTRTGALIAKVLNPDGQQYSLAIHDAETMAVSPTGNWLYITKLEFDATTKSYKFYVAAFNTLKQKFLPARLFLSGCERPTLLPSAKDLELNAICSGGTSVHKISFDQPEALDTLLALPAGLKESRIAVVMDQFQIGSLTFISGAGAVFSMDTSTGHITTRGTSLRFGKNPGLVRAFVSDTRREGYFGSAIADHNWSERFDEIVGIDANNGAVVRTARVLPFFNVAFSRDEKTVFLLRPLQSTITVMDASTMKKAKSIQLVGKTPYYAVAQ